MTAQPLRSPSPERNAMPPAPKWALTGPHATGAEYELLRDQLLVGGLDIPGGGARFVTADAALEELVADANRGAVATELLDALRNLMVWRPNHDGAKRCDCKRCDGYRDAEAAIRRAEEHWAPSPVVEART